MEYTMLSRNMVIYINVKVMRENSKLSERVHHTVR
jgi:hypothetical protein